MMPSTSCNAARQWWPLASWAVAATTILLITSPAFAGDNPGAVPNDVPKDVKPENATAGINRPNVIVIVSDDHRADLMGCMGHSIIKTPNMDRLAREGMLFENAFATSGVCSPSRGSILTGKYSHQAGTPRIVWTNNTFRAQEKPFPTRLHDAGYHAAHIGKWHLGQGNLGMPGYDHWEGFEWLGAYFDTELVINGEAKTFKGFSDDIISQRAAEYIQARAKTKEPFCVFVGLKAPHLNFSYPPRLEHAFDGVDIPKPDSFDEDYEKTGRMPFLKNAIGIKTFVGGMPMFDNSWEKYVKSYYRSAQSIDDAVGTILKAVDNAGIADNTIVIYTSDQGYTLGEHGLCEKHFCHEETMRVPMLVRYPKRIKPGTRRKEMALNIDIAPTVLDLCDASIPKDMVGSSWAPLIDADEKPVDSWRDDFLFELASEGDHIPGQVAVRTEHHKLVTYPWISKPWKELYDLEKDPHEMRNVVDDPTYANVLADMEQRLARLKRETDWAKLVGYPLQTCWILGPVPSASLSAVRDAVVSEPYFDPSRNAIKTKDGTFRWKKHVLQKTEQAGPLDLARTIGPGAKGTIFLTILIERLSEQDPYTLATIRPVIPMKGYVNGRKYHDTPGGPGAVQSLKSAYNPPLLTRENTFILEFEARPSITIQLRAPEGKLQLRERF